MKDAEWFSVQTRGNAARLLLVADGRIVCMESARDLPPDFRLFGIVFRTWADQQTESGATIKPAPHHLTLVR